MPSGRHPVPLSLGIKAARDVAHSHAQRAKTYFFSLKKLGKNGGGQNITHLFFGTFPAKKACFGQVFKMRADLSLSIVDFFGVIFPFNHIILLCCV